MRSDDSNESNLTIIAHNRCNTQTIRWYSQCSSCHRYFAIGNRFQQSSVIRTRIGLHHRAHAITHDLKHISMTVNADATYDGG